MHTCRRSVFVFFVLVILARTVCGESWTWDGGSPTTSGWSDPTNWVGNASAPVSDSSTDLIFGNGPWLFSSNNLGTFRLRDMVFVASSPLYVIGGPIEVYRSIISSSAVTFVVMAPITLGADISVRSVSGDLGLSAVDSSEGYRLRTEGGGTISIAGMSGGGGLDVHGPGETLLTGGSSYTGATRVYGGTLSALGDNCLQGSASLLVQGVATAATHSGSGFFSDSAQGRRADITGTGAVFDTQYYGGFRMGGASNVLAASQGAQVLCGGTLEINGTNNIVKVFGANAGILATNLFIRHAQNVCIEATNGGRLNVWGIMSEVTASGTLIRVAGTGSVLEANGAYAALSGTGERIEISEGASCNAAIGLGGTGGRAVVSGAVLSVVSLGIAMQGSSNTFVITGGSRVEALQTQLASGDRLLVEISGAGTAVTNPNGLLMGGVSRTAVRVTDGAEWHSGNVLAGGTDDEFLFSGPGTRVTAGNFTFIDNGAGRIAVSNGAELVTGSVMTMGTGAHVVVTGAGSVWNANGGWTNSTSLRVADGARLSTLNATMEGPSTEITGSGTVWSNAGFFAVSSSSADLHVSGGAQLYVGGDADLGGTVTVVGAGSEFIVRSNVLLAGSMGVHGGTLSAQTIANLGEQQFVFSAGTVNVSQIVLNASQPFEVGDGTHSAVLNLEGTAATTSRFSRGLIIRPEAVLIGQGTIQNDVTVEGRLSPGHSAGRMIVASNITFGIASETIMEIFGPGDGQFDVVQAQSITFGGLLQVSLSGFTPTNGMRFRIFDAAAYSGSFSSTNISGFVGGFDATSGEVFVTAPIPEAGTLALVIGGLAVLFHLRKNPRTPSASIRGRR